MIERDPLHFKSLVDAHQAQLRQDWLIAQSGPGPIRQAIGRQLIHLGRLLEGKHADLQELRQTGAAPVNTALAHR